MKLRLLGRTPAYRRALLLVLALLVGPWHAAASQDGADLTVATSVCIEQIAGVRDIELAAVRTQPGDAAPAVLSVHWAPEVSGWLPVWALQLRSDVGVLPAAYGNSLSLVQATPTVGACYDVTLSYAPGLGAAAARVVRAGDGRVLYAGTVAVAPYAGPVYAEPAIVSTGFVPFGVTWEPGSLDAGGRFSPSTVFASHDEPVYVRLLVPEPLPPGEFRIVLSTADGERTITSVTAQATETYIPLGTGLPFGESVLRLEYAGDGGVLIAEEKRIVLGQLFFEMQRIVPDRKAGVIRSSFTVTTAAPLEHEVAAAAHVQIAELVWNAPNKAFDLVPYAREEIALGTLDLGSRENVLPFEMALPDREGNWRLSVDVRVAGNPVVYVGGGEHNFSTHAPAGLQPGAAYTFVVFPDTQHFARSYPHIFLRMTDWVARNAAEMNIAGVLHVGDITHNNTAVEWDNAYAAMSLLHDVVPYVLTIGNHDMLTGTTAPKRGATQVNRYFPFEQAMRYSNLAGTMVPGRIENSYSVFTVGDVQYLILALEFAPPDEALDWANEVVRQHPDHRVIVLTHSYTAKTGQLSQAVLSNEIMQDTGTTANTPADIWRKLVSVHPNVFMVISGHTTPDLPVIPYRVAERGPGLQPVYELLFDYQNQDNGGNGWLGLLTFLPDGTLDVTLYSPYLGAQAQFRDRYGFTSRLTIDLATGEVVQKFF